MDGNLSVVPCGLLGHGLAVTEGGWHFVQPLLSSSYLGYGVTNLTNDSEEVDALLSHLVEELHVTRVVIVGHSTGCQNALHFLSSDAATRAVVTGIVLQVCPAWITGSVSAAAPVVGVPCVRVTDPSHYCCVRLCGCVGVYVRCACAGWCE